MSRSFIYCGILTVALLTLFFASCDIKKSGPPDQPNTPLQPSIDKNQYDIAEEFLDKLRKDSVEAIIFSKRTCISCCDFFNIFWTVDGKSFLKKIYKDNKNEIISTEPILLTNNILFQQLFNSYPALKEMDMYETEPYLDHFCLTEIRIVNNQDSVTNFRIMDSNFYEDLGYMPSSSEVERSSKYAANLGSKWNELLITIENLLAGMSETPERELMSLRIRRYKD